LRYNLLFMDKLNRKSAPQLTIPFDRPVTLADLQAFQKSLKEQLLKEIKVILLDQPQPPPRKWLKNKAVAEMLGISAGTLQTLRDNGTIPHSRIGRNIYYDPRDIDKEIERRMSFGRSHMNQYLSIR